MVAKSVLISISQTSLQNGNNKEWTLKTNLLSIDIEYSFKKKKMKTPEYINKLRLTLN